MNNLRRHPSISGTLPLTKPSMPSDSSRSRHITGPRTRVHGDGFADDEAIGDELANCLAGVGIGDLVDFVGVEPDFAFATVRYRGREALLRAEVHPGDVFMSVGNR